MRLPGAGRPGRVGARQELRIIAVNLKRFQEEAAKLREELKFAITQLPTSKEIPSLLANVSNLGKDSGLEFLLFRPMPEVNRDFYAEIPVEIKVRGTYHDVAAFFDKVGKLPRIVNIHSVAMDGAKEAGGRWEIITACTATTFKFIEKDAADLAKEKDKKDEKKDDKNKAEESEVVSKYFLYYGEDYLLPFFLRDITTVWLSAQVPSPRPALMVYVPLLRPFTSQLNIYSSLDVS